MPRRLLLAYLVALWALALLPLGAGRPAAARAGEPWIQSVPLATIRDAAARGLTLATVVSIAGNVVAFLPLGALAPAALPGLRRWWRTVALALAVSLAIEGSQLAKSLAVGYPYRRTDVDDLLLNGLGAAAGYAIWAAVRRQPRTRSGASDPR